LEWSVIPLLAGLGLVNALKSLDKKVATNLKWPNDLLIGDKKVAGILVEAKENGVVVGIGLNVEMAKSELYRIIENAEELFQLLDDNTQLEAWVQSKLTKANEYLDSVTQYLKYQSLPNPISMDEEKREVYYLNK
jgi:biotin-(acetyl-CoA carboxylase) ligase